MKCEICGTCIKYEFINKKYHTKSCECGCVTKVYDLKGNLLMVTKLEKVDD